MEKLLGKIESVSFGIGGYQDAMLGIHITLSGSGWGVCTEKTAWDSTLIKCSDHAKWTENDRSRFYDEIMRFISKILNEAKVKTVSELRGIPIEAEFEEAGMALKSWRILTEVL